MHCGDPGDVQHAEKSGGYFYGDWVTYQCHTGYEMTSGDPVLHCGVTFVWSGIRPNCTSIFCFSFKYTVNDIGQFLKYKYTDKIQIYIKTILMNNFIY